MKKTIPIVLILSYLQVIESNVIPTLSDITTDVEESQEKTRTVVKDEATEIKKTIVDTIGELVTDLDAADFPNLGAGTGNRFDRINEDEESILEWQKKIYALVRSMHNLIFSTGQRRTITRNEI